MLQSQLQRRRSMAGIFWIATMAAGVALALTNLYAGLLLVALGTLVALAVARADALPALRATTAGATGGRRAALGRSEQRALADSAGEPRAAFVAHRDAESGYETLLTSEGLVVVNASGERVLPMGRR
jgi:hypothetical protein